MESEHQLPEILQTHFKRTNTLVGQFIVKQATLFICQLNDPFQVLLINMRLFGFILLIHLALSDLQTQYLSNSIAQTIPIFSQYLSHSLDLTEITFRAGETS